MSARFAAGDITIDRIDWLVICIQSYVLRTPQQSSSLPGRTGPESGKGPRMLKVVAAAAAFVVIQAGICSAAPPAAGSEQDAILSPHGDWIRGLMNPFTKQGCCDLSDCRVVSARVRQGHYQAFIARETYGDDAPDLWIEVPDEVVLHERTNPVGLPIACWRASRQPLYNGFFCFQDGPAT